MTFETKKYTDATFSATTTAPKAADYTNIRITQKYVRSAVADEIDFLVYKYKKLPAIVRWLIGDEIKRNIIRLETMLAVARERKAL
jgi:hypothetical protein